MAVTRRRFVGGAMAAGAAAAATHLPTAEATTELAPSNASATLPPLAVIALNRMGFGPRPGDIAAFQKLGATPEAQLTAYVDQQLDPNLDDSACDQILANTKLKIKYDASGNPDNPYPAVNEARQLSLLDVPLSQLWPLRGNNKPFPERRRPFDEINVATWVRAVYSKRQLKEVLVDFWHNHFNVNVNSANEIAATFPLYDQLMRKHCFGNFREFLEDIGKSVAMMYYLDNISSQAGGGEGSNENYARELFELHTLSTENYLKFYDNSKGVGFVTYDGKQYAKGYVDEDVYEAADCLAGWTIADGRYGKPDTGEFFFKQDWHQSRSFIVLSIEGYLTIKPTGNGLDDGRRVYDMLAAHPGVARAVCLKLCRRLIADNPPSSVLDAAVKVWMDNTTAPDQLKKVIRTILLSDAFKSTWGQKVKRPFESIVSYIRAVNGQLASDEMFPDDPNRGFYWGGLFYNMSLTGQNLYQWPTPTGHPDLATYWVSTNSLLRRWNLPEFIKYEWAGKVQIDIEGQTDLTKTCIQIVDLWIDKIFGHEIDSNVRQNMIDFISQGGDPNKKPIPVKGEPGNDPQVVKDRVIGMVQLLAATPDFQYR